MTSRKPAPPLSDVDFARVRAMVLDLTGIDVPELRRGDLERAVDIGLRTAGIRSLDVLERRLRDPETHERTLEPMLPSITVGETHFFRNRAQIDALERHVLPGLIARNAEKKTLRIWSAGCSSGEEPYTLAILLDRLLPDPEAWDVRITATDIDPIALQKARTAVYGSWSFREVPEGIVRRYFEPRGDRLALDPKIKSRVTFSRLNLVEDDFQAGLDLVLCRNVLIYFRPETVQSVVDRMHASLTPGGWLVVGHVEPCSSVFGDFDSHTFPGTIVYQRPDRVRDAHAKRTQRRATVQPLPARPLPPRRIFERKPVPAPVPAVPAAVIAAPAELDAVRLVREGLELVAAGRAEDAVTSLRGSLFLDQDNPLAHYVLADALLALDRPGRARKALDNAASLLASREGDDSLPGGDGLTASRLSELVSARVALAA